jgi:hypothetical protein
VLDELPIAVLPTPIEDEPILIIEDKDRYEVRGTRYEVSTEPTSYPATSHPATLLAHQTEIENPIDTESQPTQAVFSSQLIAISTIPLTAENATLSPKTDLLIEPKFEEELEFEPSEFRLIERVAGNERLLAAADQFIVTPAKTIIHNVVRRFYVRKTEVELFLEEVEMPRFFAQR